LFLLSLLSAFLSDRQERFATIDRDLQFSAMTDFFFLFSVAAFRGFAACGLIAFQYANVASSFFSSFFLPHSFY